MKRGTKPEYLTWKLNEDQLKASFQIGNDLLEALRFVSYYYNLFHEIVQSECVYMFVACVWACVHVPACMHEGTEVAARNFKKVVVQCSESSKAWPICACLCRSMAG